MNGRSEIAVASCSKSASALLSVRLQMPCRDPNGAVRMSSATRVTFAMPQPYVNDLAGPTCMRYRAKSPPTCSYCRVQAVCRKQFRIT